jgi:hypothetical protein
VFWHNAEPGENRGIILARAILHAAAAALRSARSPSATPSTSTAAAVTYGLSGAQLALLQLAHLCLTLLARREADELTVVSDPKKLLPTDSPTLCAELTAALELRKQQLTAVRRALLCSAAEARLACATTATAAASGGSSSICEGLAVIKRRAAELALACCTAAESSARASTATAAANGHVYGKGHYHKHCFNTLIAAHLTRVLGDVMCTSSARRIRHVIIAFLLSHQAQSRLLSAWAS